MKRWKKALRCTLASLEHDLQKPFKSSSDNFEKLSHSPPAHCPAAIPPLSWHSFDGTQFPVSPDGALHAPCPHLTNVTSGKTFGSENYVTMIVIWRAVDSRDFLHNSWNEKVNILMLCNCSFNFIFQHSKFLSFNFGWNPSTHIDYLSHFLRETDCWSSWTCWTGLEFHMMSRWSMSGSRETLKFSSLNGFELFEFMNFFLLTLQFLLHMLRAPATAAE